jgi:hypothetical protein
MPAYAAINYTDSAHGDPVYGVNRSSMPEAYAVGNCGHCHVQHGIGTEDGTSGTAYPYVVFNPNFVDQQALPYESQDSVCFRCHTASSSEQDGGSILNPDFAETYGGYDEGTSQGVLEQYNPDTVLEDSLHTLEEVRAYAAGEFTWFRSDSTACVACHNPHLARRIKSDVDNPNLTPISLPSEHESLWGDDSSETMAAYTDYQAPYHYNSTSTYEPGGLAISDPSTVPDYATFCNECHYEQIYTDKLGRNLLKVDWSNNGTDSSPGGDKHGQTSRSDPTWLRDPYLTANKSNYVLSCTDCHEPHASPYPFLMRRSINGQPLNLTDYSQDADGRGYQCLQCHKDDSRIGTDGGNVNDWKEQHHGMGLDSPYSGRNNIGPSGQKLDSCDCHGAFEGDNGSGSDPIRCEICHHHGSFVPNPAGEWPATVTPKNGARKTF